MYRFLRWQDRGIVALVAVTALVVAGCGGNSATPAPSATPTSAASATATDSAGTNANAGLAGAAAALGNQNSYKFSMSLIGDFGSMLASLAGSTDTADNISGTITLMPDKQADINGSGFHIIETQGFDYMDLAGTGSFSQTPITNSMVDTFSPSTIFSNSIVASTFADWNLVGTESKGGVQADHYQADDAAVATYGSVLGITGATWTTDVWVAHDGGYLLSVNISAKAADGSMPYEMKFDITNVNDAGNKVAAPTNVTGA
jgi:hypothetical protein